jgi:hypothetical protein
MSPDLIYLPFWKIKQGWEQDKAEYEERVRRRQEREFFRFIRTPEGEAWLKAVKAREEEIADREEMQARDADAAKRRQAALRQAVADGVAPAMRPAEPPPERERRGTVECVALPRRRPKP